MKNPIITRRHLLGTTTAAAGTLVLPSTRANAFLLGGSGESGGSPIKDITLDNTVFTGSLGGVDTLIGQIRTVPPTAVTWSVDGTDGGRFKVVTGSAWQKSPTRIDPTLQTNGIVAGRANGFSIDITATPTGGGSPFTKCFTLGPPTAPTLRGTVHRIAPPSSSAAIQAVINAAAANDTIYFDPGTFTIATHIIMKAGQLYICGLGTDAATIEGPSGDHICFVAGGVNGGSANNCTIYGLHFKRSGIGIDGSVSGLTITNCSFTTENYNGPINQACAIFAINPSDCTIEWCTFTNCQGGYKFYYPDYTTVTRCSFVDVHQCGGIAPGAATQGRNIIGTKNYMTGIQRMGFEWHPEIGGDGYMTNLLCADNYCIDFKGPINPDYGGFGFSIVPAHGTGNQILRNFFKPGPALGTYGDPGTIGHGYGIEFNSTDPVTVSDNYINGLGSSPNFLPDAAIFGPYSGAPHILSNNNNINCNDAYGWGGDTMMNGGPNAIVTGTTHNDLGLPAPFSAGAGP